MPKAKNDHPTVTDIRPLLVRVAEAQGLTMYAWGKKAGDTNLLKDLMKDQPDGSRKIRSPTLERLDLAARAIGKDDFVDMASGVPRFDRELLREAIVEAIALRDHGDRQLSAEDCANLVIAVCDHYARRTDNRQPGELRRALEISLDYAGQVSSD